MEANRSARDQGLLAVKIIHSVFPMLLAIFLISAPLAAKVWPPGRNGSPEVVSQNRLRLLNIFLLIGIVFTYLLEATSSLAGLPSKDGVLIPESTPLYDLVSALLWLVAIFQYPGPQCPIRFSVYGSWGIYLIAEVILFSILRAYRFSNESLSILCHATRVTFMLLLFCAILGARITPLKVSSGEDEESAPLIDHNVQSSASEPLQTAATGMAYGSCNSQSIGCTRNNKKGPGKKSNTHQEFTTGDDADRCVCEKKEIGTFIEGFKMLVPFFWPSGKLRLQLVYVGVTLCLIVQRALNLLIPLQIGLITNILSSPTGILPWKEVLFFGVLRLLDSGAGIQAIQKFIWVPLEDFAYEKLSTTAFNQIMTLSCDFHDNKQSGRLWQTIYRAQSVKDVVNSLCFHVLPLIADLFLAVSVLYYIFDAYMALVVGAVAVMFVWTSGKVLSKEREKRREWIESRTEEFTVMCESTANWQTVSYFNRVPHEKNRYRQAVQNHLKARFSFKLWAEVGNMTQSLFLTLGLMCACFMATYKVATGLKPIGSFVMLLSYWGQLSGPLQLIASGLGDIALDIVDVEELLELLRQKPSVTEPNDAKSIFLDQGDIEFSGVNFSYDGRREVLRDINFQAKPGQTTALVGQTGGGKSTILKLISRFYDPGAGSVKVNGEDVSQVILSSLRENIGVVPQDPALFHDTILNNIRYARLDATDDEIIEACRAVVLHEKILGFTDGYNTIVGERGVKLSGGELQRVAIARAIVKNPRIVLLDEATSSVDSETEAHVQESLKMLTEGRTTLVVAHRLSTIMNADQIIVINDGTVVERGSHAKLLRDKGYYYRLCLRQGIVDSTGYMHEIARDVLIDDTDLVDDTKEDVAHDNSTYGADSAHRPAQYHRKDPSYLLHEDIVESRRGENSLQSGETTSRSLSQISPNVMCPSRKPGAPGKTWKPGAAEFIPGTHAVHQPTSVRSCLSTTDGNQDGEKKVEPQQVCEITTSISAEKENWLNQMDAPETNSPGPHGFGPVFTDQEHSQESSNEDPSADMIRMPYPPTTHSRKLTKSEPTGRGLVLDQSGSTDKVVPRATAEDKTSTKLTGPTLTRAQRRRRKRQAQKEGKATSKVPHSTGGSGLPEQHQSQLAKTGSRMRTNTSLG